VAINVSIFVWRRHPRTEADVRRLLRHVIEMLRMPRILVALRALYISIERR
jgi:hypothetical protein